MKKGLRITIWVVLIALLAAGFFITLFNNKEAAAIEMRKEIAPLPFSVLVTRVQQGTFIDETSFRGIVEPRNIVTIYSEADGKVVSAMIEKGRAVRKGQTLAVTDATIREASNRINSISIEKARQDYELAKRNYDRYQALLKENNASVVEAENAAQQLKASEIELQSLRQQQAISAKQVEQTIITSPLSGVIIEKKVFPGDFVQVGAPLGTIADLSSVIVKIYVPETVVAKLRVGEEAAIKADALPAVSFTGRIKAIIPVANEARAFPVELEIANNRQQKLMGGMSTSVFFSKHPHSAGLVVPRTALFVEDEKQFVWVIDDSKKPQKRQVSVNGYHGPGVSVGTGLKPGDLVVISGQNNIEPGKVLKNYTIQK